MKASDGTENPKQVFFDDLAEEWDERGFPPEELEKVERLHRRLGDLDGLVVFEPGCGAGRLTRLLAEWVGPSGRVVAVDNSARMAAAARAAVAKAAGAAPTSGTPVTLGTRSSAGDPDRTQPKREEGCLLGAVEVRCEDAVASDFPPGSFDLALLFCVFPHFDDKAAALRRFAGEVRPGGRLVIAHLEGSARLNVFHDGVGGAVARDRIPAQPTLEGWLRDAGLDVRSWIDCDEEFYLEAVVPDGR